MAAPGLVTPRKQERFQVTLVAHSHLYGPLLTILPHKNLYFAQLAPASREAAQNPASSISAELQRVFANLQIESDKSANKEALFLPICPGSHSSNKFPTTQNQALGLVHRHLWALPVHPGATGPAAAPAPSCLQTCCSTLGNHIIFIFNFWIDPSWEKLCMPIFFMCLSCHLFRKILVTIFFSPPSPSPVGGIYLGNLLKRVAEACIMHEMQSLFLHSTVCILKQEWHRVPARKMNISSSQKKRKKKMPIYLKESEKTPLHSFKLF